jgi:hypothetical protein
MNVAKTRIEINLKDGATAGLHNLNRSYQGFTNSVRASSGLSRSMGDLTNQVSKSAESVRNLDKMVSRLGYSVARYAVIYQGLKGIGNLFDTAVGGAYRYAKNIETNEIGMSGILTSMMTLNGKTLEWNEAMSVSKGIIKDLQSESLKTAATAEELINAYRAILGPGLSAGMKLDEIKTLTTVGVNAVSSLGLPSNQIIQELRDLVQGGIRPANSTLATSLGLTDADIKAAKQSSEGLFKFLMNRLKGFELATKYTQDTVRGALAQIEEGVQRGIAEGAKPLYDAYGGTLRGIANSLVTIDEKTKEAKINPEFEKSIENISNRTLSIAKDLKDVGETGLPYLTSAASPVMGTMGHFFDNIKLAIGALTLYKGSKFFGDLLMVFSDRNYQSTTAIGSVLQGWRDRLSGVAQEYERLELKQKAFIDTLSEIEQSVTAYNQLDNYIKSSGNSVTNLADKWKRMGMSAEEAAQWQSRVYKTLQTGGEEAAEQVIRTADKFAEAAQKTKQTAQQTASALQRELKGISKFAKEINATTAEMRVDRFLKSDDTIQWQKEQVKALTEELKKLGLAQQDVYKFTEAYMNTLKRGGQAEANSLFGQVLKSAEQYQVAIKQINTEQEKAIQLSGEQALKLSALHNAYTVGGEKAYRALQQLINREEQLIVEMKRRGLVTKEVEETMTRHLQLVTEATKQNTDAIIQNGNAALQAREKMLGLGTATGGFLGRLNGGLGVLSSASLGVSILTEATKGLTGVNDELADSISDGAMKLSMFSWGLEGAIRFIKESAIPAFIALKGAITGIGVAGAIAGGVVTTIAAATAYGANKSYGELKDGKYVLKNAMGEPIGRDGHVLEEGEEPIYIKSGENDFGNSGSVGLSDEEKARRRAGQDVQKMIEANRSSELQLKQFQQQTEEAAAKAKRSAEEHVYKVDIPIGAELSAQAGQRLGEDWGKNACAEFVSAMLEQTGISGLKSNWVPDLINQAGESYFKANSGYVPKAGDLVVWNGTNNDGQSHIGIMNDKGQAVSSTNHGVREYNANDTSIFGEIDGYISMASYTAGQTIEKSLDSAGMKQNKYATKVAESYAKIQGIIADLNKETALANDDLSAYDKVMAKATEKVASYQAEIAKAQSLGVDTSRIKAATDAYLNAQKEVAHRAALDEANEQYNLEITNAQRIRDLGLGTIEEQRDILTQRLEDYKAFLEKTLEEETLTAKKRSELEGKLAATNKQIHEQKATMWTGAMDTVLDQMARRQINYAESIMNVFDTVEQSGAKMLASTGSVKDRMKAFFDDITQSILSNMAKIIMRGLVTKAILSIFGMGGGGISPIGGSGTIKNPYMFPAVNVIGGRIPGNANGGQVGKGWHLVGEEGAELVHFGNSGRVFNHSDTKKLMNNGNTPVNLKMEIRNESGTPVKAEQEGIKFDGESYILSVVLKGIAENKMGMRSIMKSATNLG